MWTSTPAQGATAGQLVLVTDSANQLSEIFVPGASSQQVIYYYSGSGCTWGANTPDLCAVKDVLGNTTSYTYDGPSFEYYLLTVTPPGGIGYYSNVYNSAGQVTEQTNPVAGDTTTFYYGTATPTPTTTSLTTTTVSVYGTGSTAPDETEYDYADGLLTAVVRGLGTGSPGMASAIRNPTVLLDTSVTDAVGNTVADTYQTGGSPTSAANVVAAVDGVGKEVQAAYGADNQVWCSVDAADYADGTRCPSSPPAAPPSPGTTDPNLGATISLYNAADELTAVTDPLGNTTTYAYTPAGDGVPVGLQYCAVDPVDYQAGLSCPAYGASHVPGTATETFNAAGYVVTSTDADGHTTSYTYSTTNPGLVATTTGPDGTVTSYSYDAAGDALLATVSFGSYSATTQVAYDGAERQFCEVAPAEYAQGRPLPGAADHDPDARERSLPRRHDHDLQRRQPGDPDDQPARGDHLHRLRRRRPGLLLGRPLRGGRGRDVPLGTTFFAADGRQRPVSRGDDHDLQRRGPSCPGDEPARRDHTHELRRGGERARNDRRVEQPDGGPEPRHLLQLRRRQPRRPDHRRLWLGEPGDDRAVLRPERPRLLLGVGQCLRPRVSGLPVPEPGRRVGSRRRRARQVAVLVDADLRARPTTPRRRSTTPTATRCRPPTPTSRPPSRPSTATAGPTAPPTR